MTDQLLENSMTSQTARAAIPQTPVLLRETLGSIAVLTLNRPDARNSLSEGLIGELHAALKDVCDDTNVRAVVIAANGPAFSSRSEEHTSELQSRLHLVCRLLLEK